MDENQLTIKMRLKEQEIGNNISSMFDICVGVGNEQDQEQVEPFQWIIAGHNK